MQWLKCLKFKHRCLFIDFQSRVEQRESRDYSAFGCTCLRELCVMLRHLMAFRAEQLTSRRSQSFTSVLRDVLRDVLSDNAISSNQQSHISKNLMPLLL